MRPDPVQIPSAPLDASRIAALLATWGREVPVTVARETNSTNDDARRAAGAGASSPAAFLAESQTRGRGRSGASWHSPPGENLYLSVLLEPAVEPHEVPALTLAVGAEIARCVERRAPGRVRIKWPNDLWLDDAKLAGVLVEGQIRGDRLSSVVVGIGLNVHTRDFPPELRGRATSLLRAGVQADRSELAAELVDAVLRAERTFASRGVAPYLAPLRTLDALFGRRLRVDATAGVGAGIDDAGRLLVDTGEGLVPVVSGHVELVPS